MSLSTAKKCLKNLGLDSKTEEIRSFFVQDDEDDANQLHLDEESFVRFAISKAIQVDKAYKVFELMDQDGKGVVVLEDLERVAAELGEDISRDELEEMVQFADGSGEGLLTAQDFIRMARKVNL
jgi:Ca2+-binding EF-hand superfamily protein